jgi:AcrR family transcriptional regulator
MKKVVDAAHSAAHGLRERKKLRTREAIIDAALDLFATKGFDATTVEDIAAAAEVSPRTFFRYFDSKLDLVMARNAAKDEDHGDIGDLLGARPPEEGPLEAMRNMFHDFLRDRLDDPSVVREFQVMLTTPTLRTFVRERFFEHEGEIAAAFAPRMGVEPNDLAAHVLAAAASSAIWSAVDRWVAAGAAPDRLLPTIDEAFAVLGATTAAGAGGRSPRRGAGS